MGKVIEESVRPVRNLFKMDMQEPPDMSGQNALIAKQNQLEQQRLAEATSDVERRKAMMGKSGRSLLIKTSQRGVTPATTANLGG